MYRFSKHCSDAARLNHLLTAHTGFDHLNDHVEASEDSEAQKLWVFWLVGFKHQDFDGDLFLFKCAGVVTGIAHQL